MLLFLEGSHLIPQENQEANHFCSAPKSLDLGRGSERKRSGCEGKEGRVEGTGVLRKQNSEKRNVLEAELGSPLPRALRTKWGHLPSRAEEEVLHCIWSLHWCPDHSLWICREREFFAQHTPEPLKTYRVHGSQGSR